MTYFPHRLNRRPAANPPAPLATVKQAALRDILWGQPLFKAPALCHPRVARDPLPFTAARITRRPPPA